MPRRSRAAQARSRAGAAWGRHSAPSIHWPGSRRQAAATLSTAVRPWARRTVCQVRATPERARRMAGHPVASRPSIRTLPESARTEPASRLNRVDLPAPLKPHRPNSPWRGTSRDTESTASTPP